MLLKLLYCVTKTKCTQSILFLVRRTSTWPKTSSRTLLSKSSTPSVADVTPKKENSFPWAMRIAHNLCVDHFSKVKRTPSIKTSDDRDIFEVIDFTEEGAEEKMMKRQSHERVRMMLDLVTGRPA